MERYTQHHTLQKKQRQKNSCQNTFSINQCVARQDIFVFVGKIFGSLIILSNFHPKRVLLCWFCCFEDHGFNELHIKDLSEGLSNLKHERIGNFLGFCNILFWNCYFSKIDKGGEEDNSEDGDENDYAGINVDTGCSCDFDVCDFDC